MIREKEIFLKTQSSSRIDLACYTVIGDRPEQQDRLYFRLEEQGAMALICDGMGGQKGGEEAACKAAELLSGAWDAGRPPEENLRSMIAASREADRQIAALTDGSGLPIGAGSTLTAVFVQDGKLNWVSIGDTRAYLLRGPDLVQITRDQNYRAVLDEQLEKGFIGEEEYRQEDRRGDALISYLGIGSLELIDYSNQPFPLEAGDRVLLASDGLYRTVSDEELSRILQNFRQPEEALSALEQKAARNAEKKKVVRDNTTAVLLIIK